MSVIPAENPRYEDQIVITAMSQRTANTRFGAKTVVDVTDSRERVFQIWPTKDGSIELANQAFNLAFNPQTNQPNGATLRIEYTEKPASDPQYPPNRQIMVIGPGSGAQQAAPMAPPAPQAFAPGAAAAGVTQAPMAAAAIPQGSSGPSADDKVHMRRSAAAKAAATYCAGTGEDLWKIMAEILVFIETGEDPIPFLAEGPAETGY